MARQIRKPTATERNRRTQERVRKKEVENHPTGSGGGPPSYAIQVKQKSGTLTVADNVLTAMAFSDVYFENNNGVMWPTVGSNNPPNPGESMFSTADPAVLFAPVEGLWGFRFGYAYTSIPLATWYRTVVHLSGSPVGIYPHAREALPPGGATFANCDGMGTAYMTAGDWLKPYIHQRSGGSLTIDTSGGSVDDTPGDGPIFAMWLIAPRV